MMPVVRQCAAGIVITGNAWWLGIHTAGPGGPQFDPPQQANQIESFNQDRQGEDFWRWAGSFSGNRTVLQLERGECVDVFLPGDREGPSVVVAAWLPGDWNFDGMVNSADISAFLTSWLGSAGTPEREGDFNLDGVVNSADISAFLAAWLAQ